MNNSSKSKLFLILALHRSGSSAVAGVLDLLGVDMGIIYYQPHQQTQKVF